MVTMRSERRKISSRSAEESSIAQPSFRLSMMAVCMNSMAPMSIPREGFEMTSTGVSCENSRATTTFCMLPPDMEPTGVCMPAPRMSNFL